MKRQIIYLLLSLLAILPLQAQLAMGTWKQYPIFGEFTDLIDTERGVWYVTGGCLYHYDSNADETRFYEGGKELSGFTVKFVRHYPARDMLAVAYTDGNIDMILPDGSRVNLPEIKDATVNVEKTINDIVFEGDEMFVATAFGLVIYDLNRLEVKESGIYHRDIRTVIVTPGHILIAPSANKDWRYSLMIIERGVHINNYDNFREACGYYDLINQAVPLDDTHTVFATIRYNYAGSLTVGPDGSVSMYNENTRDKKLSHLSTSADGTVRFISTDGQLCHYVDPRTIAVDCTVPEEFKNNLYATSKGISSIWLADSKGYGNYDMSGDGMTVLRDKSLPNNAISFNEVCNIFPSNDMSRFYIANLGFSQHHPIGNTGGLGKKMRLNMLHDGIIETIEPTGATANSPAGTQYVKQQGPYIFGMTQIAEDPDIEGRLFVGSGSEGVYVVEGDKVVMKIDGNNAPISLFANYYWGVTGVTVDPDGNLWVGTQADAVKTSLIMLPSAIRKRKSLSDITASDWIVPEYGKLLKARDIKLLHCRHSNMIFGIDSEIYRGFVAVNHKGSPAAVTKHVYKGVYSPVDQDGKVFDPTLWTCLAEDKRGHVWMGTSSGVISITNPAKACDPDFTINRIKVPRNDGSGLADYLLESDKIVSIAVDNSNRKWIATAASGLFLVSEDGDRILSHFTTANSPLPSNTITAVYADPTSNSVFVGTLAGLYEYCSTSGPAKEDYSDVYAYPNPVTPDYSGWITITGLMESSLVKIMDSAMHLVYQTTSEGGTALWDGCDSGGARVRSGVYYVLASSRQDDSSMSSSSEGDVVAKILVVN